MKIVSWNVNGIRSVFQKNFLSWMKESNPDIVCLQEIKGDERELGAEYKEIDGYYAYFNSSKVKKGHSGVAVYSKMKPISIETILGIERFDEEGRCLKLEFDDFILFNFYIPNGARDQHDIPYKLDVYKKLFEVLRGIKDKEIILVGDFNIAHQEIDVFNAKHNHRNTMFTKEERSQIDILLGLGYVDVLREKYPDKKVYTWWPYMGDLRERDIGWRIDYFFITKKLARKVHDAFTQKEVLGSDHGILGITLDLPRREENGPVYTKQAAATLF